MFILDYVNGGELFTHLVQRVRFKEQEVALYSGEIVLALEHLHEVMSRLISTWISFCPFTATRFMFIFRFAARDCLPGLKTGKYSPGFKRSYSSDRLWDE